MKPNFLFIRTTLAGGILFLVPIIVVVFILEKAVDIAHKIADPLAKNLPVHSLVGFNTPMGLAILLLVLFCFLSGLFAQTKLSKKIILGLEGTLLSKLPGYAFLKSVSESMLGMDTTNAYPVVLAYLDGSWQIGFLTEKIENTLVAVFVPDAPNPQSGAVYFLAPDKVRPLNVPMSAAVKCLSRLGAGSHKLLRGVSPPNFDQELEKTDRNEKGAR